MYQHRVIAFIDILGFGALVEKSASDQSLQESIRSALNSIGPEKINDEDFIRINRDAVPPDKLDQVIEVAKLFTQAVRQEHPIAISYFSDCIAISAPSEDLLASQTVLDLVCKLNIRIWTDHKLTLRGGIASGLLYHEDGGQIFGPAMNCAYYLESKSAIYPRILMDPDCVELFKRQKTFTPMLPLIGNDNENRSQISLADSYHFTLTSSTWTIGADDYYEHCYQQLQDLPSQLRMIAESHEDQRIAEKFRWLVSEAESAIERTPKRT